jgi:GYF domain 2/RDD family
MSWYFADADGQQHGPIGQEELFKRIHAGSITAETLLWTEGLESWTPAGELAVLDQAKHRTEPPPPAPEFVQRPSATLHPSLPNPFHRFLARQLDFLLFQFLVVKALGAEVFGPETNVYTWLIGMYLVWAFLEGLLIHFLGQTPGKWLMRIELSDAHGKRLSLMSSLRRSFDVAVRGVGLGLPYAHLFAMLFGLYHLTGRGITPWDRSARVVVVHRPLEFVRLLALFLLTFALLRSSVGLLQPVA